MLNFSHNGPIDELIAAVEALPESTDTVPADFALAVKALAVSRLNAVRTERITHAHLNLTANIIAPMNSQQCLVAVKGHSGPPKPLPISPKAS